MSFLSNGDGYGYVKSRLEKPFAFERQKDNVLKFKIL